MLRLGTFARRTRSGSLGSICGLLVAIAVGRRCQYDASGRKHLARPAQHLEAFEHGAERGPLQAVTARDDRQRQADTPGPMRRKCRISERAPEREQADRQPDRLSGEGQLACFARVHADNRDLLSV
jgi:hypothetical protein